LRGNLRGIHGPRYSGALFVSDGNPFGSPIGMVESYNMTADIRPQQLPPNVIHFERFREAAGLTQEDAGRLVGVTRQTIAAWERGERSPSVDQLARLARAFRITLADFLGITTTEVETPRLLFRADDPVALSSNLETMLCRRASDYAEVEKLAGEPPTLPESRPYDDTEPDILEGVARELRDWLGVEDGPLGEVVELLETRGIKVIPHPLNEKVSGFSAFRDDWGGVIFVNANHPTERQYFTAIHELAHLVLHRRDYSDSPVEVPVPAGPGRPRKHPRERAADYVAAAVLLPEHVLRRELRWYRQRWLPEALLADLRYRYRVSTRTVVMRAADLGLISERQRGQQLGTLTKGHGTRGEPGEELPKPQGTRRLQRLVMVALLREEMTTSRAAEVLGQSHLEVRDELARWLEGAPA
jgi:Zn-dependent peptidase ImmA (M78 family)/DNA-binding XRE family transcriptional regulator